MRKPIIAGNWKMHKTVEESIVLTNGIKRDVFDIDNVEVVLCPPFTSLSDVGDMLTNTNIAMGAQNMHREAEGAYTGEISAKMLKAVGCKYVIIGHSERRIYFGETNETVNRKLKAALKEGLLPIMCVGENLKEREGGKAFDVVAEHVEKGLDGISGKGIENMVIAYEPVWAIGTGKNATPDQAQEIHKFIRGILIKKYGNEISQKVRIQYGGSAKPDNIEVLMREKDIDGALVGGASLKEESFASMVKRTAKAVDIKE